MKPDKKEAMANDVEEHIAEHDLKNHHYLRDNEIIAHFKGKYKKKHVKMVLSNLRYG